jgi:hypothetical protein
MAAIFVATAARSPVVAETLDEAEVRNLERTLAFIRANDGLEARTGLRIAISADVLDRLLETVAPVSVPLADDLGSLEIQSIDTDFTDGLPRLSIEARAAFLGGTATVPAAVDAAAIISHGDDGRLRLAIAILSVRPDIGLLSSLPGTAGLIESAATARVAALADSLAITAPLADDIEVPIAGRSAPLSFNVGEAAVTLTLTLPSFTGAARFKVEEILTLADGIYVYGDVD